MATEPVLPADYVAPLGEPHEVFNSETKQFERNPRQVDEATPMLCDNCGKPMAEHDALAHCWGPESKTFTHMSTGKPMTEQSKYRKVGSLDYSDTMGTLTPVLSCQGCGALVVEKEIHDQWHSMYCEYVGSNRRLRHNDGCSEVPDGN